MLLQYWQEILKTNKINFVAILPDNVSAILPQYFHAIFAILSWNIYEIL